MLFVNLGKVFLVNLRGRDFLEFAKFLFLFIDQKVPKVSGVSYLAQVIR